MTLGRRLTLRMAAAFEKASLVMKAIPPEALTPEALAAYLETTIRRYVTGLIEQEEIALRVLDDPALSDEWPLTQGLHQPPTNDIPPTLEGRFLELERAEGARTRWPLDIAPGHVAEALRKVRNDRDAQLVAGLLEHKPSPTRPALGKKFRAALAAIADPLAPTSALVALESNDALPLAVFPPLSADSDGETPLHRWAPLAVALVLHIERRIRENTALHASHRALARIRVLYGAHLHDHVLDALVRESADDRSIAPSELAAAMREALRTLGSSIGADDPSRWPKTEEEASVTIDGLTAIDAKFVELISSLGKRGAAVAQQMRDSAMSRSTEQQNSPTVSAAALWDKWEKDRAVLLACILWDSTVRLRVEEQKRKPASLVYPVYEEAVRFHSRVGKFSHDNRTLSFEGRKIAQLVEASFDLDIIERGLSILGSVTSHRLFQWEVRTGHEQKLNNHPYPHVLDVEGGWSALASTLGLNPEKHVPDLKAIIYAQAHFRFTFPDGSIGTMLSYTERAAAGRHERARVTISLGVPLLPGYVHRLNPGERKLVPMLKQNPPLYGRANEHGEQLTMALALVGEMRIRSIEVAQQGGIQLSHDERTKLADRSGLPRRLIVPVFNLWLRGDSRTPPLLKAIDGERVTLSDAHANERAFLEEGGRQELDGQQRGRESVVKRRSRLAKSSGLSKP